MLKIRGISTKGKVAAKKKAMKRVEFDGWIPLGSQGKGHRYFQNSPEGNFFLYSDAVLKDNRFIVALRLRSDTVSTRAVLGRYQQLPDILWRRCSYKNETTAHIIGECFEDRSHRIRRSNEIVALVKSECEKWNYAVQEEPTFEVDGERYKPDLIVETRSSRFIVDVTVRYEEESSLDIANREKITKYTPLCAIFSPEKQTKVIAVVVGSRWPLPKFTIRALKELAIVKVGLLRTISLITLRSSIEIFNAHFDYG